MGNIINESPPARAAWIETSWFLALLLQEGTVRDYAELARLGEVSRARITQIMSLRHLAPAIQERILALPAVSSAAEEGVNERQLRGVAQRCDWREQLRMWEELEGGKRKSARGGEKGGPC